MGVPFEALIPYGIIVVVCAPALATWTTSLDYEANNCRCSVRQVQVFRKSDTCKMAERGPDIRSTSGIG